MKAPHLIVGALVIFGIVFAYNWVSRKDWDRFLHDTNIQVGALEKDTSSLQKEQADLARVLRAAAAVARQNQTQYAQRKAQEPDDKAKAVWGIWLDGSLFTLMGITTQRKALDDLRSITTHFDGSVVRSLRLIQQSLSPRDGNASGYKPPDPLVQSVRAQLALLETTVTAMTPLIVQMRAVLTDEASSLKDQELRIQTLMPVGVDRGVTMTDDTVKAVESVLQANAKSQEMLARLAKSTDEFGKMVYRTGDIVKAQSAFMAARM